MLHVPERTVSPVVELGHLRPRAPLGVELNVGHAEAHEAREERLVHLGILLEGRVFDHRGKLVVVANEHHALEARGLALVLLL